MQPLFNAASYVVFDPSYAFVNQSFPYSRIAVLGFLNPTSLIISMEVATGYTDLAKQANVILNGVSIGRIEPHPFGIPSFNSAVVTFIVPASKIPPPFDPITRSAIAVLGIVPTNADPDNWLSVGAVVCQYPAQGALL